MTPEDKEFFKLGPFLTFLGGPGLFGLTVLWVIAWRTYDHPLEFTDIALSSVLAGLFWYMMYRVSSEKLQQIRERTPTSEFQKARRKVHYTLILYPLVAIFLGIVVGDLVVPYVE